MIIYLALEVLITMLCTIHALFMCTCIHKVYKVKWPLIISEFSMVYESLTVFCYISIGVKALHFTDIVILAILFPMLSVVSLCISYIVLYKNDGQINKYEHMIFLFLVAIIFAGTSTIQRAIHTNNVLNLIDVIAACAVYIVMLLYDRMEGAENSDNNLIVVTLLFGFIGVAFKLSNKHDIEAVNILAMWLMMFGIITLVRLLFRRVRDKQRKGIY